jgi:SPP1 family predicted phage head-tail adaptor
MAQLTRTAPDGTRTAEVRLEQRVEAASGFPIETWAPLRTLWMQKVDLIGSEALRADQLSARYDVRFIGPYAPELDPELVDVPATQRLLHRGRVYDIVSAAVVGHFAGIEYHALTHSGGV